MTGARCGAPLPRGYSCRRPVRTEGARCHLHPVFIVDASKAFPDDPDGVVFVIIGGPLSVIFDESGRASLKLRTRDALDLAHRIAHEVTRFASRFDTEVDANSPRSASESRT